MTGLTPNERWFYIDFGNIPRYDVELSSVKSSYEVCFLFILHDPLELEREPSHVVINSRFPGPPSPLQEAYSLAISTLSESTTSLWKTSSKDSQERNHDCVTLIIITKVDWNNEGFAAGSRTVELDWKDWKSPVMSRLRAKLLRNRTWSKLSLRVVRRDKIPAYQVGNGGIEQNK